MKGNVYTVMRKWNHDRWVHFDIWNHAREIGIEVTVPKTQCLFIPEINCGDELTETQLITLLMELFVFVITDGKSNENADNSAYMKYMKGGEENCESKTD